MVALVGIVFDDGGNLALEITGQTVMLPPDTVPRGQVPPFDLAFGPSVMGCTVNMIHALFVEVIRQVLRDVEGDDAAAAIARNGAEVEPAPAQNLQVSSSIGYAS